MPHPSTDDYLRAMEQTFAPEEARGARAILQYRFTGREPGECYAIVEDGTLRVARGSHPTPTVTVTSDFDLWMRITTHEVDGLMAFQDGLYAVTGDGETLMISDTWFRR